MHCGSCYAWAALGMLESRIRIVSNNSLNVSLSVQDVVECSPYSQGCSGGFPYLVGKYAEDFGLVHENCNPYTGKSNQYQHFTWVYGEGRQGRRPTSLFVGLTPLLDTRVKKEGKK